MISVHKARHLAAGGESLLVRGQVLGIIFILTPTPPHSCW